MMKASSHTNLATSGHGDYRRDELHLLEIPNFSNAPSGTIPVPPFSLSQGALPAGQGKAYIQNIHNRLNIIICRISPIQAHLIRQDGLDDALLPTLDPPHLLSPLVHLLRLQFQLGLRCENRYQALYGGEVEMMKPLIHFLMQTYRNDNLKAWHKITWDSSTMSTELNTAWTHCCL